MVHSQTVNAQTMQWSMPIASWAIWDARTAEATSQKPELSFVDPMQRRRLSPLARAAFHVANMCTGERTGIPIVYASRHGELNRTMELFVSLANQEPLSPTTFGLSVLNANVGLYSLARRDMAPSTAVSAGSETFGLGLLEAWGRTKETDGPVLYVYADTAPPHPIQPDAHDSPGVLAIGLLIDPAAEERVHCSIVVSQEAVDGDATAQAEAFLEVLSSARHGSWTGNRRYWQWMR